MAKRTTSRSKTARGSHPEDTVGEQSVDTAFAPSNLPKNLDAVSTVAGLPHTLRPSQRKRTHLSRADMEAAIRAKGSVLFNRQIIRDVAQLPSQKDIDAFHAEALARANRRRGIVRV